MKLVKHKFPNVELLWRFRLEIGAHVCKMNARALILVCLCSEADINLAKTKYGAEVIKADVPDSVMTSPFFFPAFAARPAVLLQVV